MFLIRVPATVQPGTYPVSLVYWQGSTSVSSGGVKVRLTVSLTVTNHPAASGDSPACALSHAAAPAGYLNAPSTVAPESTIRVAVAGVSQRRLDVLDRTYQFRYVACLGARATTVSGPAPERRASGSSSRPACCRASTP